MADQVGLGHRERWAFYRLPPAAQAIFRMRVMEARCENRRALEVFGSISIADILRPVVELYDVVKVTLGHLPEDELAVADAFLFGSTSPHRGAQAFIRQVLARGRVDGLDDIHIAAGIAVVLESHGLLQRPV